jgi:hypothetical protein
MQSEFNLDGKPPSGKKSSCGSEISSNSSREGRRECMFPGSDFKFMQPSNSSLLKYGTANPPSRKDTKLGHSAIFK